MGKQRLDWIGKRLVAIRRRPIDLARALGIAPSRVYEMLADKRQLQEDEIMPAARFLEMDVRELRKKLGGASDGDPAPWSAPDSVVTEWERDIPVRGTKPLANGRFLLTDDDVDRGRRPPRLSGRTDVFGFYLTDNKMAHWRKQGRLIYVEQNRMPAEGDYALIRYNGGDGQEAEVRYLVKIDDDSVEVCQHNPELHYKIPRKKIRDMLRVIEWEDLMI